MGPPPKPVLQLVTRLHPAMRKRIARSAEAIESKLWREDLTAVGRGRQAGRDQRAPGDPGRRRGGAVRRGPGQHLVDRARRHMTDDIYLHHKYTMPACLAGGRLPGRRHGLDRRDQRRAAGAAPRALGDLAGVRGRRAGGRRQGDRLLRPCPRDRWPVRPRPARSWQPSPPTRSPGPPCRRTWTPSAGAVSGTTSGQDGRGDARHARRGARDRRGGALSSSPDEDTGLATIRELVAEEHREDFDDRLGEVRLIYRLRDERGVYSDGWATGLARRAMLEAGRRLTASGRLHHPEHAVQLTADEARRPAARSAAAPVRTRWPSAIEWWAAATPSTTHRSSSALCRPRPRRSEWLPKRAHRSARADEHLRRQPVHGAGHRRTPRPSSAAWR